MHEQSCSVSGPCSHSGRSTLPVPRSEDEVTLVELRRKVQSGELLSAATERLLGKMKFNGHLTVAIQNGRVVKSGYQEGYFRRRHAPGGVLSESL